MSAEYVEALVGQELSLSRKSAEETVKLYSRINEVIINSGLIPQIDSFFSSLGDDPGYLIADRRYIYGTPIEIRERIVLVTPFSSNKLITGFTARFVDNTSLYDRVEAVEIQLGINNDMNFEDDSEIESTDPIEESNNHIRPYWWLKDYPKRVNDMTSDRSINLGFMENPFFDSPHEFGEPLQFEPDSDPAEVMKKNKETLDDYFEELRRLLVKPTS